jgi:hypothetical protein
MALPQAEATAVLKPASHGVVVKVLVWCGTATDGGRRFVEFDLQIGHVQLR